MRPGNRMSDDDAMDETDDTESWRGNKRRRLWKDACTRAALNVSEVILELAQRAEPVRRRT